MGGRPVNLGANGYSTRRTIYGYVDRRNLPEVFNQFDFANPDITTGKRYETIVPQQALFMMNSPLVVEQARNLVNSPRTSRTPPAPRPASNSFTTWFTNANRLPLKSSSA